jgi:DNA mismatch repair protein MutS2
MATDAPTEELPEEDFAPAEHLDQALEWRRFLELAADQARTEPGENLVYDLEFPAHWAASVPEANRMQQETHEAMGLLDREALWSPLLELADPFPILDRLGREAVLEISELAEIRRWLVAGDSWSQVPRDEIRGELFKKALHALPDASEPLRGLDKILTPDGELSEKASPRLGALYTEIRNLKREIAAVLDHLVKTYSQKGVLQENFTDVRDGRYVIPIKISHQNDVEGIIYEASASRQTVFVEPQEVSPLNNRLRQRQNELLQEILAILDEASRRLRPFGAELTRMVGILSHWDAVQARARVARVYGGKTLEVTESREIRIERTANPLLWWAIPAEKVIRNDVAFGDPARTLLLTGPNTGGKTVLLKTLGLAAVFARTGFALPATGDPKVPFFDSVFADLGDPQSIEQHLSSFSGHISRFKQMLEQLTDRSLVLIDELNSATDPEEGAALGRAFLETLMRRQAMIVATTHDPRLKALAQSDSRIVNASMAFDETARAPTYKILIGVPGRSRALDTARRLGLSEDVVALAESYLSEEHKHFEGLLARLENDARDATRLKQEAQAMKEEAERIRREWQARTENSMAELMDRTRQKLRRVLEQAQDEVRASVKKLDEARSRKELDTTRSGLNQAFSDAARRIDSALEEEAPDVAAALKASAVAPVLEEKPSLAPGATVRIPKWKSTGKVLELQGGKVKVAMGSLQMTLSMGEVEMLSPGQAPKHSTGPRIRDVDAPAAPPPSIDLRGVRFEEAMQRLEQYLDQAFRSGALVEVTIVHGLGTGAIREGARGILSKLPYVKEYRDGGAGRGGSGATVVEFDR